MDGKDFGELVQKCSKDINSFPEREMLNVVTALMLAFLRFPNGFLRLSGKANGVNQRKGAWLWVVSGPGGFKLFGARYHFAENLLPRTVDEHYPVISQYLLSNWEDAKSLVAFRFGDDCCRSWGTDSAQTFRMPLDNSRSHSGKTQAFVWMMQILRRTLSKLSGIFEDLKKNRSTVFQVCFHCKKSCSHLKFIVEVSTLGLSFSARPPCRWMPSVLCGSDAESLPLDASTAAGGESPQVWVLGGLVDVVDFSLKLHKWILGDFGVCPDSSQRNGVRKIRSSIKRLNKKPSKSFLEL